MKHAKRRLQQLMAETPYLNYLYSYPHKTSYREISPAISLEEQWQKEDKSALFLYFHIPFCEMRCGFCNLFTTSNPEQSLVSQYLLKLEQQARQVDKALGEYQFSNIAIGGGTPTYLTADELKQLFNIASEQLHVDLKKIPIGIETSPATVTEDRLRVLKEHHVNRISIGIESFSVRDANSMGRPQKQSKVDNALNLIQQAEFDTLNIDLIYGAEGQTIGRWLESVHQAIEWKASEIYLYPLYVRPLTGLGRKGQQNWDDQRLESYYQARDVLLAAGFQQISMRMFQRVKPPLHASGEYHCQEDGMVGLGCGARSYTQTLHYSSDYAVKRKSILDIIKHFVALPPEALSHIDYGFQLNLDEQQRRYILLSLLQCEGLSRTSYRQRFGHDVLSHYPELEVLQQESLAHITEENMRLNKRGIAYSDVIGSWFFSPTVNKKMKEYTWR